MYLTLATIPFVILVGSSRARPGERDKVTAHEM
jgi:hypothetical protein